MKLDNELREEKKNLDLALERSYIDNWVKTTQTQDIEGSTTQVQNVEKSTTQAQDVEKSTTQAQDIE
jgi:hypothetical protein